MTPDPDDIAWMQEAIKEAQQAGIDVPIGAVVVAGGVIVGRGFNRKEQRKDPTEHAELIAIKEACRALDRWRLEDATIYTTLEPCPMCAEAIIQARIKRLVFAAYDKIGGACGSSFNLFVEGRALPLPAVTGGVMENECKEILQAFFKQLRTR